MNASASLSIDAQCHNLALLAIMGADSRRIHHHRNTPQGFAEGRQCESLVLEYANRIIALRTQQAAETNRAIFVYY